MNTWGNTNTSSPDMVTPSYVDSGFPAPTGGIPVKPPRGYINWLFNYLTNAVSYFMQKGISAWDSGESGYTSGSVVSHLFVLYQLVGTATTGTAPPNDANWMPLLNRDAYGLPFGGYSEWFETWAGFGIYVNTGGASIQNGLGRWQFKVTGTDTNAKVQAFSQGSPSAYGVGPGFSNFYHAGGVEIDVGKNTGDYSRVIDLFPMTLLDDNVVVSIQTIMTPPTGDTAYWLFGFSNCQEITAIADGAFFIVNQGGTTWHARTIVNNVATDQDTGIAVGTLPTPRRIRIVCIGANMNLGARQILFFIDGQLVATSTTNLPFINVGGTGVDGSSGAVAVIMGGQRASSASVASQGFFGPVKYAQRSAVSR